MHYMYVPASKKTGYLSAIPEYCALTNLHAKEKITFNAGVQCSYIQAQA